VERERQTGNVKLLFRKNYCTFDNISITWLNTVKLSVKYEVKKSHLRMTVKLNTTRLCSNDATASSKKGTRIDIGYRLSLHQAIIGGVLPANFVTRNNKIPVAMENK